MQAFSWTHVAGVILIQCSCGAVKLQIGSTPILQYVCHCDDCQIVHGRAYPCSLYAATDVVLVSGETEAFTLKTSPRTRCKQCGTYLFAEVPNHPVRGVNADLLPAGMFEPAFHIQCRFAARPVLDDLPHYKGVPAHFGGSDELMHWHEQHGQ
jgi:hypothetical protein